MGKIQGLFVAICLIPQLLSANRYSCEPQIGYGIVEASAGLLYLRPSLCPLDFAIKDPNQTGELPEGTAKIFHPEYAIGVRAAIGYGSRCPTHGANTDGRVEYTYLHTRHLNRACAPQGGSLWPTLAHPRYLGTLPPLVEGTIPAFDKVKSLFDYDAIDLQLATHAPLMRCLDLRAYTGLHFLNLDHKLTQEIQGVVPQSPIGNNLLLFDSWEDNRGFWGIGPLLGFDTTFHLQKSLRLTGHIAMALITGEERWRRKEQVTVLQNTTPLIDQPLDVKQGEKGCFTPYIRGGLGVMYCLRIPWSYQLTAEVSYEFHSYINGEGLFRFNDQRGTGLFARKSFYLDGIVLVVRLFV